MEKIRHAIIGVGGIGKEHARVAHELNEFELIAVSDIDEKVAKDIGEKYHVKWYKDYIEMIEKEKPDSVSICTPHFLHKDMAINAMKYGVNVLVEKPMAVTVKQADEMIRVARKRNVKLAVVFQHRFDSQIKAAKKIIGSIGDIYRSSLEYCCYRSQQYYGMAKWRGTWKYEGGGVLINQAIHSLDSFLWIVNLKPKKVFAAIDTLIHNIEVEDTVVAIIEFKNKTKGYIYITSNYMPSYERLVFQGNNGVVEIYRNSIEHIKYSPPLKEAMFKKTEIKWGIEPKLERESVKLETSSIKGHEAVFKDFANAIVEDREPLVNGEEGRKSIEVINGIIMSGFLGKEVNFPINAEEYEKVFKKLIELRRISK